MKSKTRVKPFEIALFVVPLLILLGGYLMLRSEKVAEVAAKREARRTLPPATGAKYSSSTVFSLAFSPDGQRLATGDMKGTFKWWDTRTGALRKELDISPAKREWARRDWAKKRWEAQDLTAKVAFSPDGRVFAANMKRSLLLFDGQTGKLKRVLTGPQKELRDLAFTPDSQFVACGTSPFFPFGKDYSQNGVICLWDVKTGELVAKLQSKPGVPYVQALDISADGQWLVALCGARRSIGLDYIVQLWDLKTRRMQWEKHSAGSWGEVRFSPDSHTVAIGGQAPILLETKTGASLRTLQVIKNMSVSHLAFTDGGKSILGSSDFRPLCLWNVSDGEPIVPDFKNPKSFGLAAVTFAFSQDHRYLAYANDHEKVELWDVSQMKGNITDDFDPLTKPKRLWKVDPVTNSPAY